jgi:hypothetical protein
VAERVVFNDPGTTFVNNTSRVQYQFIASLQNTCGACLQYHLAIGGWWPMPIHHRCRCRQVFIRPGNAAPHPFVDFRKLLADLPHAQQVAAIGASNYRLLKAGVVTWEEIVTRYRVRTLREVIALNKVSTATALKAGVKPGWIKAAHEAVHTPEAELIRQHRQQLIDDLKQRGVSQEQLVHEISRGLVPNVTIVGTTATESMARYAAKIPHAEGLAAVLAAWQRPVKPIVPEPKKATPFQEQVWKAVEDVPAERLVGDKAWIHDVYAAHQNVPSNPRLTLDEFKRLLLEDENRGTIALSRADLAHRMDQGDVARSETTYVIGNETKATATFNFIRPKKKQ